MNSRGADGNALLDSEFVQQADQLFGKQRHARHLRRRRAVTMTIEIIHQDPIALTESRTVVLPNAAIQAETMDEYDHRRTVGTAQFVTASISAGLRSYSLARHVLARRWRP